MDEGRAVDVVYRDFSKTFDRYHTVGCCIRLNLTGSRLRLLIGNKIGLMTEDRRWLWRVVFQTGGL